MSDLRVSVLVILFHFISLRSLAFVTFPIAIHCPRSLFVVVLKLPRPRSHITELYYITEMLFFLVWMAMHLFVRAIFIQRNLIFSLCYIWWQFTIISTAVWLSGNSPFEEQEHCSITHYPDAPALFADPDWRLSPSVVIKPCFFIVVLVQEKTWIKCCQGLIVKYYQTIIGTEQVANL